MKAHPLMTARAGRKEVSGENKEPDSSRKLLEQPEVGKVTDGSMRAENEASQEADLSAEENISQEDPENVKLKYSNDPSSTDQVKEPQGGEIAKEPANEVTAEAGEGGQPPVEPPDNSISSNKKEPEKDDEDGMSLLDHLAELRRCLTRALICAVIGFAACWAFVDPIFNLLVNPLLAILPAGTHAQYTTLPEAFFTRVYVAFVAGLFLASPAIFYQIWAFVAPGLYEEEKRWILPIALLSAIFFVAGAVFCYFIVFPFAFNFFISYSTPEIVITPKVSDYLNFVIKLLLAFGLIFEMPIFTFFLARLGIITAAMMRKFRRYAIVAIFILAAILTPPDVVSQLLMAMPMLLLYEASIWVAVLFGKRKSGESSQNKTGEEGNA